MPSILDQWRGIAIYNPDTLAFEMWTGSLKTGALTIGKVDQGSAGASAWKVDGSAVTQPVSFVRATVATTTSVGDSASNVTLLASNANRLGATFYNTSSAILYLKLGATATTASYTAQIAQSGYYEMPFSYTGIVDGIWASDAGGACVVTEVT